VDIFVHQDKAQEDAGGEGGATARRAAGDHQRRGDSDG